MDEPPIGAATAPGPDRPLPDYRPGDPKRRKTLPLLLEIPLELPHGPVWRIMYNATEGSVKLSKPSTDLARYFAENYIAELSKTAAVLARAEGRVIVLDRHMEAAARLYVMNRGQQ